MIFHTSLAAMTKTPELVLENEEAKALSESGLTLLALYDIKPDPKIEAAILFAGNIGMVYGTRFVAIRARQKTEAKNKKEGKATVFNPDGTTAGFTEFQTVDEIKPEWPLGGSPVN